MTRFFEFQSTHPVWGETGYTERHVRRLLNFNPLTPCGVRRGWKWHLPQSTNFNPLTPCGVRPTPTTLK